MTDGSTTPGADDAANFAGLAARFEELRELDTAAREQRLQQLAAREPATADSLRRLLGLHDDDRDALAAPEQALPQSLVAKALASAVANAPPPPPPQIGPYRLLRLLGRGGMGEVHLAERTGADFQQQVAIKLLRQDFGNRALVERFRTERRILAGLQHPYIASMLDGGTTDDGRPYVVMEFVDGVDLTTYCQQRQLDLHARLRLFLRVAAGVEHAHHNLVVHRDLKPGNILVTASGEPKLLDFGIAKLLASAETDTSQPDTAQPELTGAATLLLTPEYCSPEQVRGEPITTATDVYALGAILYELLSGQRAQQPSTRSITALAEAVCDRIPPPPSVAAMTASAAAPAGSSPRRLAQRLRGDLDTIVACALRKEPARRYGTVQALVDDIGRYLDGLPVLAGPPSAAYRTNKLVRRNRLPVAAAVLVLALAVTFVVQTVRQNREIRQERDLAEAARVVAEGQRNTSTAIADFLVGLYEMAEPDPERAKQLRARELLDRGAARIDGDLAAEPLQRALLKSAMGRAYLNLGLPDDAEPLLLAASAILDRDDADPAERAEIEHHLGVLMQQRERYDEADWLLRASIARRGEDSPAARKHRVRSHIALASMLRENGRLDDGDHELLAATADLQPIAADEPRTAADLLTARAALLRERGRYDDSLAMLQQARELLRATFGPDHPAHANNLREFGETYKDAGRFAEAGQALEQALAHDRRIGGEQNPDVDTDLFLLAMLASEEGNFDRAEELLREVLRRDRERFGEGHAYTALDLGQIAAVLSRRGDDERAEQLYLQALAIQRRALPADHPELATTLGNLGSLYNRTGRIDEAAKYIEEALEIRQRIYPPDHPNVLTSRSQMAVIAFARGNVALAEQQFRLILEARRRTLGDHPQVAGSLLSLATAVARQGRTDEAAQLLEESLAMYRRLLPPLHVDLARPLYVLGMLRLGQGEHARAEPLLREATACRQQSLTPTSDDLVRCQRALARCLALQGKRDEAIALLRPVVDVLREREPDSEQTAALVADLAELYDKAGDAANAAALRSGK